MAPVDRPAVPRRHDRRSRPVECSHAYLDALRLAPAPVQSGIEMFRLAGAHKLPLWAPGSRST